MPELTARGMSSPSQRRVYLDSHATTAVDPRVAQVVIGAMTTVFGNANSIDHVYGEEAASLVECARVETAALFGAVADDVYFTSGASESIRLAIGHAIVTRASRGLPCRVLASSVEHRAVLDALGEWVTAGSARVDYIPVDDRARIELDALRAACSRGVDLVCVMAANNEVGTIYPVAEVARIASEYGALSLVDATQAAGRIPISVEGMECTYMVLSAHKMYGPKGVGALISPYAVLGAHSHTPGVGYGTPNVPGIAGLGEACRLRSLEMLGDECRIGALRDSLQRRLLSDIGELEVNGDLDRRLSGNLHISVPGVPNDAVVARLRRRVALSTGAACSSGAQSPSHVLRAMGLPQWRQAGALRIGLSRTTTESELEFAAYQLVRAVHATRRAMMSA